MVVILDGSLFGAKKILLKKNAQKAVYYTVRKELSTSELYLYEQTMS
jgi:hypothetical protein